MYKFFVTENQISNEIINITDDDVNHIKNVLRLEKGEKIEVCNINSSINYLCEIMQINKQNVIIKILDKLESKSEAKVYLHIFQGLPKQEKMETIIQKTTEIGVSEITPVIMKRCVVKLDDKSSAKKLLRWQKIAEVAAKQSKRDKIPKINSPIFVKNVYEFIKNYDIVLVAYEKETDNSLKQELKKINKKGKVKIAVVIGPEGGIDETEIKYLKQENVKIITLGKRISRTETAPIVVSSNIFYELEE